MEDTILEMFGNEIYKKCFKEVIPKHDKIVGDKEKQAMEDCLYRFTSSYQVVTKSFVGYLAQQPKKGYFGVDADE